MVFVAGPSDELRAVFRAEGAGLCAWIPENASDGLPGELLHNFIHIRILNKLQAGFPADPDIEEGTGS